MYPGSHGGVELDFCSGCHGVWLDRSELKTVSGATDDLPEAQPSSVTSYSCPRCGGRLAERPYSDSSGLQVDCCRSCRGVYLDKGELLAVKNLAEAAEGAFPAGRLARLQKSSSRREALSAIYKTGNPVAKESAADRVEFIRKVYTLLVGTLIVTAIGAFVGLQQAALARAIFLPAIIVELLVFFVALACRRTPGVNLVVLFAYTFISGFTLSVIVARYVSLGRVGIVWQALAVTAGIFLTLTAYVHITKRDFSSMGGFLYASLSGLILSGLVLLFTGGSFEWFLWSTVGAVTFTGFILYDTSNIILKYPTDEIVAATLELYLDIVNLFLDLLRILSYVRK